VVVVVAAVVVVVVVVVVAMFLLGAMPLVMAVTVVTGVTLPMR